MEHLEGIASVEPFPHFIIKSFYNEEELDLIWEELNFYTKPGKFLPPKDYGGIEGFTDAKALCLDNVYSAGGEEVDYRKLSNILTVNRKLFEYEYKLFRQHPHWFFENIMTRSGFYSIKLSY